MHVCVLLKCLIQFGSHSPTIAVSHWREQKSASCSVRKPGCFSSPNVVHRPGVFWESCWSSVSRGSPEKLALTPVKGPQQWTLPARGRAGKQKAVSVSMYSCIWAVIRRCHPHLDVDLPSSGNLMKKPLWSACQPAFQFIPHSASLATRPAISHTIFKTITTNEAFCDANTFNEIILILK